MVAPLRTELVLALTLAGCASSVTPSPQPDAAVDAVTDAPVTPDTVTDIVASDVTIDLPADVALDAPADVAVDVTNDAVDVAMDRVRDVTADGCVANLMRDPRNCGACGVVCCGGWCFNGVCGAEGPPGVTACPSDRTDCIGPIPVDTRNDPRNCGACGARCGDGCYCADGRCQCPSDAGLDAPDVTDVADAPAADATLCMPGGGLTCSAGLSCQCCPAGGPLSHCLCTTTCRTAADCRTPGLSRCDLDTLTGGSGLCMPDSLVCRWGAVCAAADTPIATPTGERPIASLAVGDVVYGRRDGALTPVRVTAVSRTRVWRHTLVRVHLGNGRTVEMSAGHPTVEGSRFGALTQGATLGGAEVQATAVIDYDGSHTYDIVTDGDRGAYVAAGVLVGSTLWRDAER